MAILKIFPKLSSSQDCKYKHSLKKCISSPILLVVLISMIEVRNPELEWMEAVSVDLSQPLQSWPLKEWFRELLLDNFSWHLGSGFSLCRPHVCCSPWNSHSNLWSIRNLTPPCCSLSVACNPGQTPVFKVEKSIAVMKASVPKCERYTGFLWVDTAEKAVPLWYPAHGVRSDTLKGLVWS